MVYSGIDLSKNLKCIFKKIRVRNTRRIGDRERGGQSKMAPIKFSVYLKACLFLCISAENVTPQAHSISSTKIYYFLPLEKKISSGYVKNYK